MLNAFCTSYAEHLSKYAGGSMCWSMVGMHGKSLTSLGKNHVNVQQHQHLIMLNIQPACPEETNDYCIHIHIFKIAATCLLRAYLGKCDPVLLSKDMFPLLHSTHALRLGLLVLCKDMFWPVHISQASGLCRAGLVQTS